MLTSPANGSDDAPDHGHANALVAHTLASDGLK
jgi:hypothetical protein